MGYGTTNPWSTPIAEKHHTIIDKHKSLQNSVEELKQQLEGLNVSQVSRGHLEEMKNSCVSIILQLTRELSKLGYKPDPSLHTENRNPEITTLVSLHMQSVIAKDQIDELILRQKTDEEILHEAYLDLKSSLEGEGIESIRSSIPSEDLPTRHMPTNKSPNRTFAIEELPSNNPLRNILDTTLYHTTKWSNLVAILQAGGMATRNYLKKYRPDIYNRLIETANTIDGSPMNSGEDNLLFFSRDRSQDYGECVISFNGTDIAYKGLFIGASSTDTEALSEIVVTDTPTIRRSYFEGVDTPSELFLSIKKAQIVVPKTRLYETYQVLILSGFTSDWIKSHVHSYDDSVKSATIERRKEAALRYVPEDSKDRISNDRKPIVGEYGKVNPFYRIVA